MGINILVPDCFLGLGYFYIKGRNMTKQDIIRMAQEAGFDDFAIGVRQELLERFAALVASAEREACAKLLEEAAQAAKDVDPQGFVWIAIKTSAEGIRERGQA